MELSDAYLHDVVKNYASNPNNRCTDMILSPSQFQSIANRIRTYVQKVLNIAEPTDDQIWEAYNAVKHVKGVVGGRQGRTKGKGGVGGRSWKGSS